jgi:hypothetical protein
VPAKLLLRDSFPKLIRPVVNIELSGIVEKKKLSDADIITYPERRVALKTLGGGLSYVGALKFQ